MALDLRRAILPLWEALKLVATILVRRARGKPADYPRLIRRALERLGLTYLKLGQYLAMRLDLLPEELCEELSRLYEDISPLDFQQVKQTVEMELGGSLEQFFIEFHVEPVASASVAQVHEARTYSNERVAVKVQRPGIQPIFEADIRNLVRVAALSDALGISGTLSMAEIVAEFGKWTARELDFRTEGRTADRLRHNATAHEVVPFVYWQLTTSRVLTLQFIDGMSMGEIIALVRRGREDLVLARLPNLDLPRAGHHMAHASLHQSLVCGFFHGDPHPGNVLILDDNSVAFVDFGIFGELSDYHREVVARYIESIAVGDVGEAFRYFARLSTPTELTDLRAFERDVSASIRAWYLASKRPQATFKERHIGTYFGRMLAAVRRHHLRLGIDTLLFWRAMNALDFNAVSMSAHFDLLDELRSFFKRIRPGPAERLLDVLTDRHFQTDVAALTARAPLQLEEIVQTLLRNELGPLLGVQESADERSSDLAITRGLAAALVGISLTIAAVASHAGIYVLLSILGGAVLLFGFSLVETRQR
ncbi:MAG TPA: AarF/UbiB family protein [Thermoanaerobaculia bacterium]|nr:AarF/UbiB family protein [Thermoanaerobaculia bacterium]